MSRMSSILYLLIILFSSLVVSSFNPVFSVVWLVMSFIGGAVLLWNMGCDFLAVLIIIVYVGAIAVLFLFVIMMLPTTLRPERIRTANFIPFILFSFLLTMVGKLESSSIETLDSSVLLDIKSLNCIEGISFWLYGNGIMWVILAGIILLVALVGALVLCINPSSLSQSDSRRQEVFSQITR
uniref:NADH-ubiquinone oxidoreductase chain 6 n=1 Tax=Carybdea alata TaxID=1193083 RepID=G9IBY3_CARAL|nr:NADH dehydrogenase subunit 6 [Alatina alata]